MASKVRASGPYPEAADPERPLPALTNDLLEEILLRVASHADHSFLRRYRSIHPRLLLGFVSSYAFRPVEAPNPSAAVARIVAQAAGFSFDFLPRPTGRWNRWFPFDVRNGRVLMGCDSSKGAAYLDLAVCDPLSRRYLLLPPITDDLLASVEIQKQNLFRPKASFIPSGGIEEDTSFSVILWMQSNERLGVFVFSSVSGCWSVSMSTSCNDLGLNRVNALVSGQWAKDRFYWKLYNKSTLIKLDMNTMQFCTVDLPPDHDLREIVIVESGESKFAIFSLSYKSTSIDYYTLSQNGGEKSHEWRMMNTIPLPANYISQCCLGCPAEGYIFIGCFRDDECSTYSTVLSLEIKSFNIEMVRTIFTGRSYPYFGFPPSMSPRRI